MGEGINNEIVNIRLLTDWSKCNFKCKYCIVSEQQDGFETWAEDNFKEIIKKLKSVDFRYNIRLGVQGEFFTNKTLIQGARDLSNSENCAAVNLITNLSLSSSQFEKIFSGFDISKVAVVASYHPTEIKDVKKWLETAKYMNNLLDFSIVVVAYPPIIDELVTMVNKLKEDGFHLAVQGYIGSYQGKNYPESYTPEEREKLKSITYSRHDFEYFINLKKPGMCNAGYKSLFINATNGEVLSCGIPAMRPHAKKMGNLLNDPVVDFSNEAMQCKSLRCLCDTENINTVLFQKHYERTGINQHKFRFIENSANGVGEWDMEY